MELKRRCSKCGSQDLAYTEKMEVRNWKWWQWVIGWTSAILLLPVMAIISIPLIIYLIYCIINRKKIIYGYICNDCGFTRTI